MEDWVNAGSGMAGPTPVNNVVKQGDILARVLFTSYFTAAFTHVLTTVSSLEIYIRHQTSRRLFNLLQFAANSKDFQSLYYYLLYAYYCDLVTHTVVDI